MRLISSSLLTLLLVTSSAFAQSKVAYTVVPAPDRAVELKQVGEKVARFLGTTPQYNDSILNSAMLARCAKSAESDRCINETVAWSTKRATKQLTQQNLDAVIVLQMQADQKNLGGVAHRIGRNGDVRTVLFSLIPLAADGSAAQRSTFAPSEQYLLRGNIATRLGLANEEQHVRVKDYDRELEGNGIIK